MPASAPAQHEHDPAATTPVYPPVASGTAWLPQAAPVHGFHFTAGAWQGMVHVAVFVQYIREFGTRGNYQLGSVNWFMADAARRFAGGTIRFRAMASAEALTLTGRGYPQLLQVAQPYRGETLADRMHPHEMISEAAVAYDRPLGGGLRGSLYLAAVGEPALGPPMYLHRPSAQNDPLAPLGHHAQDVTHESFGALTVGVFSRQVRVEGSFFNGAHPDDVRTNFEYAGGRLNTVATRITVNPSPHLSVAASAAYLPATGGEHAHGALRRYELSVLVSSGKSNTALIWGANVSTSTRRVLSSALVETHVAVTPRAAVFGRVEYVRRTDEELGLVGSVSPELDVKALSLGAAHQLVEWRRMSAWLGGRGNVEVVPGELRVFYGSRAPAGFSVYVQLRPPIIAQP